MNPTVQRALERAKNYGAHTQGVTERRPRHTISDKMLVKYCEVKRISREEVLNGRCDRKSVTLRAALMYLMWKEAEPHVSIDYTKSHVLTEIGKIFGMKRINVHERLETFSADVEVLRSLRTLLDEVRAAIEKAP